MRTLARRVLTEDGRVAGVDLESGPPKDRTRYSVRARHVVAYGDMLRLCEEMLDPGLVDPAFVRELRGLRATMPCFLSHIGLRDVSSELLEKISGYYWDSWDSDQLGRDALRFKVFSPTLYEPRMAPPGCQVAIIQRVREIDYDTVTDWDSEKRSFEDHVLENLGRLIPDLEEKIVVMSSASAATSYRYTLNSRGAMLGWEMSPEQLGTGRPEVTSPVENLLFVGHWTRPGGGITPVIVSAMRAAELITAGG
jgi:phytoene dehydrogenase-like protein